jgi:hypothetical protein
MRKLPTVVTVAYLTDWRRWLVKPIIPEGEKLEKPLSVAFSKEMLKDLDRIGDATNNSRADTIRHLLRWAIAAYDKAQEEEAEAARPSA